jgi:hypothetical protein
MYYVSRPTYVELYIAADGESPKDAAAYVATEYPKSTNGAAAELRTRGLDVKPQTLRDLVEDGILVKPDSDYRGYAWTRANLDRAAAVLDGEGRRTPWGFFLELFDISADQAATARDQALRSRPGAAEGDFGLLILPGIPGQGVPASVKYLSRERAVILGKGV